MVVIRLVVVLAGLTAKTSSLTLVVAAVTLVIYLVSFFAGAQQATGPRRGRDVETNVTLTFEEAVFGVERELELSMDTECSHCKGTTVEPGTTGKLAPLEGSGQTIQAVNTIFGAIQQQTTLPYL